MALNDADELLLLSLRRASIPVPAGLTALNGIEPETLISCVVASVRLILGAQGSPVPPLADRLPVNISQRHKVRSTRPSSHVGAEIVLRSVGGRLRRPLLRVSGTWASTGTAHTTRCSTLPSATSGAYSLGLPGSSQSRRAKSGLSRARLADSRASSARPWRRGSQLRAPRPPSSRVPRTASLLQPSCTPQKPRSQEALSI